MKLNKFLWSLAVLGLASCSADKLADEPIDPNQISDGTSKYMAIKIFNAQDSRAASDPYEYGSNTENAITSCRIYFFNAAGNAAAVRKTTTGSTTSMLSYYDIDVSDLKNPTPDEEPNVEKKFDAMIVISTANGDQLPTSMAAVINVAAADLPESPSIAELEAEVDNYSTGFVMSSATYADGAKVFTVPCNIKRTEEEAINNPSMIYVERLVARVDVYADGTWTGEKTITGGEGSYKIFKTGQQIGTTDIYVKFAGWYITQEMPTSNLIKDIKTDWITTAPWTGWNDGVSKHRCYWALNPNQTDLATAPAYIFHSWNETSANDVSSTKNSLYTQENASDAKIGRDFTQVLVKGTLCTEDGTVLPLVQWHGARYATLNEAKTGILANLSANSQLNYWKVDDTSGTKTVGEHKYAQMSLNDVTFATASVAKPDATQLEVTNGTTNSDDAVNAVARYKSYLQVATTTPATTWYSYDGTSMTAIANVETINSALETNAGPVLVWEDGMNYYHFKIKHINSENPTEWTYNTNNETKEAEGYYGVVRNHIYDCALTGVTGLGTPVYNPDEVIIPEDVEDDDSYIAAQIRILSWRIVKQNVVLGQ